VLPPPCCGYTLCNVNITRVLPCLLTAARETTKITQKHTCCIKPDVMTMLYIPTTWRRNAVVEIMTLPHPMYNTGDQLILCNNLILLYCFSVLSYYTLFLDLQVLLCFCLFLYCHILSHMRLSCVNKYYLLTYNFNEFHLTNLQ